MRSHAPQLVGNENAEEKKRARNSDEGQEKIKRFLRPRIICFSDRTKIDEEAEAQPEEKTGQFYHGAIISHHVPACQPGGPAGRYQDFLFDTGPVLN
jgi:hypothetical protein